MDQPELDGTLPTSPESGADVEIAGTISKKKYLIGYGILGFLAAILVVLGIITYQSL